MTWKGRATRTEYLATLAGTTTALVPVFGVVMATGGEESPIEWLLSLALISAALGNHAAAVRRLHDMGGGRSGWWTLLGGLVLPALFFVRSGPHNRFGPSHVGTQPEHAQAEQVIQYTHTGAQYLLGYTASTFAIWNLSSPTKPVAAYPRTDEGWRSAWLDFVARDPAQAEKEARAPFLPPTTTET